MITVKYNLIGYPELDNLVFYKTDNIFMYPLTGYRFAIDYEGKIYDGNVRQVRHMESRNSKWDYEVELRDVDIFEMRDPRSFIELME